MKKITDVADHELIWAQPSFAKTKYELRAGDEVVATIQFQRATLARADAEGEAWTFKREGFWRQRVTVRREGSDDNIAIFRPYAFGGGELLASSGSTFELSSAHFFHPEWTWKQGERPLMQFKGGPRMSGRSGVVALLPEALHLPELPLLTVLGWYLILLIAKDVAVVAATTAARVPVMR